MSTTDTDPAAREASVAALVGGIINDAQRLLSQQIELIRVEIKEDVRRAATGLALVAGGAIFLAIGAVLLCFMLVHLLAWAFDPHLPLWTCFLIVGGAIALAGAVLVYVAVRKFSHSLPEQSLAALKENLQWKTNPTPNPK